jgi:hypothetical protein
VNVPSEAPAAEDGEAQGHHKVIMLTRWRGIKRRAARPHGALNRRGRVLAVIDHLPHTFNFALALLTPRAFVARFPLIRFEASTARPHCRIIVATTRPLETTPSLIA